MEKYLTTKNFDRYDEQSSCCLEVNSFVQEDHESSAIEAGLLWLSTKISFVPSQRPSWPSLGLRVWGRITAVRRALWLQSRRSRVRFPRPDRRRILKFKSELTFAFFAAVNHISGPLRTQRFTSTGFVICGWWIPICLVCFSCFKGRFLSNKNSALKFRIFHVPNGKVHSGCTDPTQATACLLIVLVSRIQKSGTGDNNLVKWKDISVRPTEMTRPVKMDHLQRWSQILGRT